MKYKFLFGIIIAIALGYLSSTAIKQLKSDNVKYFNTYLLQAGIYTNDISLNNFTKSLKSYVIDKNNNKYYVYVGITTDLDNKKKLEELFNNKNIDIYSKKIYISDETFFNNLKQYDILLNELTDEKDILRVNDIILDSYKDLLKT